MVNFHSYVNLPEGKPKFIDWWIIIFSSKSLRILGGVLTIFRQTPRKAKRGFMLAVPRVFAWLVREPVLHLHCIYNGVTLYMGHHIYKYVYRDTIKIPISSNIMYAIHDS